MEGGKMIYACVDLKCKVINEREVNYRARRIGIGGGLRLHEHSHVGIARKIESFEQNAI